MEAKKINLLHTYRQSKQLQTMIASVVILFALPLASADYIFGSVYMGGSCDVRHTLLMK